MGSTNSKVIVTTNGWTNIDPAKTPTNGGSPRRAHPCGALAEPCDAARSPAALAAGEPARPPRPGGTSPAPTEASAADDAARLRLSDLGPSVTDAIDAIAAAGDGATPVVLTVPNGESLVLEPDSDAMRLIVLLADLHHERRRSRTLPGLQAARSLGRKGGRPSVIDPIRRVEIARLLTARSANGRPRFSYAEVAERTGVSRSTIARHAKAILASAP